MSRIHGFKSMETSETTRVKKTDIMQGTENGKAAKFYRPVFDCLEKCNETASAYNIQKHVYLKKPNRETHEKAEELYDEMNKAKIDLIKAHFFQMSKEEKEQAEKTIKSINSYTFEYYHREWRRSVENGGGWTKGDIYP